MTPDIPEYVVHNDQTISGFFGPYRWLSNFWPATVRWHGIVFPSVEVAYQAAKCPEVSDMYRFVNLSPAEAKQAGKTVRCDVDMWDKTKRQVMYELIIQKFASHLSLLEKLAATESRTLVEANNWKDTFWGVYYRFDVEAKIWRCMGGSNHLGQILMRVRDTLRGPYR